MATEEASKQGCDYYDFAVIGAGRMGASIAGALALNGARVAVHDRSDFDRKKGLEIMRADMKQHAEEGLISKEGCMQALSHVFFVDSLVEAARAHVVIEAIFENLEAKRELFKNLQEAAAANPDTVFATNSMNFCSTKIAAGIISPDRVFCGIRFLYPVFFIQEVEVSSSETERPLRLARVAAHLERFNLRPFYHSTANPHRRRLDGADVESAQCRQRKLKEKNLHGLLKPKTRAEDATCEATSLASRNPRMLQGEDKQCLICFEAPARALLAPCGHCDLCPDCCAKLRAREGYAKCPTCRVPIERVLQMDTD